MKKMIKTLITMIILLGILFGLAYLYRFNNYKQFKTDKIIQYHNRFK